MRADIHCGRKNPDARLADVLLDRWSDETRRSPGWMQKLLVHSLSHMAKDGRPPAMSRTAREQ
jgi:hypothetical protein